MRRFASILSVVCVLGLASASLAMTINVDINTDVSATYSGLGASPDSGTYWNGFATLVGTYTSGALTASDGTTPTSVTMTVETVNRYDNSPADFATALMGDYVYPWNPVTYATLPFSVNNLTPGGTYDLYLYSLNGAGNSAHTDFTIGGATKTALNSAAATFVENNNYVRFSGVTADAGGSIFGTAVGRDASGNPYPNAVAFNGLQITSVPEPAAMLLVATGLIGLLAYAWRKR
jgi:hypothetical protein